MDEPENHLPSTIIVFGVPMEKEWKELMRMTNILCGKVFEFCRYDVSVERRDLASEVTSKLNAIIEIMENKDQK